MVPGRTFKSNELQSFNPGLKHHEAQYFYDENPCYQNNNLKRLMATMR